MEKIYFVTHPLINKKAVVYAPSTEKARTTFLDWLERNRFVDRRNRQNFRKYMAAKRIEDPNIPVDVELHYGYKDYPMGSIFPEEEPIPEFKEIEEQKVGEVPPVTSPRFPRIPIQDVVLKGFGL